MKRPLKWKKVKKKFENFGIWTQGHTPPPLKMLRFTTMRPTKIDLSFFPGISWNFRLDTVLTYHSTYYYKKKDWRGKVGQIQKWQKCDFYCFYKSLHFESIFIISLVAEWVKASDLTILLKGGGFKSCQSQVFFFFQTVLFCYS